MKFANTIVVKIVTFQVIVPLSETMIIPLSPDHWFEGLDNVSVKTEAVQNVVTLSKAVGAVKIFSYPASLGLRSNFPADA